MTNSYERVQTDQHQQEYFLNRNSNVLNTAVDTEVHHDDLPAATHALAAGAVSAAHEYALADRAQLSPNAVAQGVLSLEDQPLHLKDADAASRRRTKVSRACDECRRKKIRCDATPDSSTEACNNCRKADLLCIFSRQPMKRGPSKGYIKELAERVHTLENQLSPHAHQPTHHSPEHPFEPEQAMFGVGKRKLTPQANTRVRRGSPEQALSEVTEQEHNYSLPPHIPRIYRSSLNRQNESVDSVQRTHSYGFGSRHTTRREAIGEPFDADGRTQQSVASAGLDESILDEYYRLIHQTFPFLPMSKARLRSRLASCSTILQDAFRMALDCAIRTYPSSNFSERRETSDTARRVSALLSNYQFEPISARTLGSDLIYIQILILLTLESDNHGPATMRGQAGPPRAEWLGRAVGMATHLKLNAIMPRDRYGEGDLDSDEKLGRRIWWVLFILDRWHASSTSSLLQLPENGTTVLLEDQILLGNSAWNLVRLSHILGHLSQILQQPPSMMEATAPAAGIIATTILGEIDRFRESVESVLLTAPNLVHLCYWHVRLMVMRLTSSTTPHELLAPAMRMASSLNSSYTTITPLNHHFAALAAMTLCELADFEETREGAQKGIEDIIDALGTKRGFGSRADSLGWDSAIRELVMRRRASTASNHPASEDQRTAGLQHLANVAVRDQDELGNSSRPSTERTVFDPTMMTRYGYLAALVQETT